MANFFNFHETMKNSIEKLKIDQKILISINQNKLKVKLNNKRFSGKQKCIKKKVLPLNFPKNYLIIHKIPFNIQVKAQMVL